MGFLEEEEMEPLRRKRTTLLEYVEALEEERRKMIVFHRELPYSLDLVSRALESYRLQLELSSEKVGEEGPVLKEFLPTKTEEPKDLDEEREEERSRKLPEWLRAAKVTEPRRESPSPSPQAKVESKNTMMVPASEVSTAEEVSGNGGRGRGGGEEKGGHRKVRRCWSPELHRRFVQALQQLGGSHVATPKQIRELMKVDGLSNDEVKSHLQKYRLHTRRGSPPVQASNSANNAQASQRQIVLIGGVWPPSSTGPLESPSLPTGDTRTEQSGHPLSRVYAPVATIPLQQQNKREKVLSSVEEQSVDGSRSNSDSSVTTTTTTTTTATTCSRTITTTESPPN